MKIEIVNYTPNLETSIANAAGICYGNDTPKSPEQLVKRLKHDSHFATFRFGHITFKVSDVSRSCAMQNLRHKFLEFLMRSQRYCKEFDFEFVIPPSIQNDPKANLVFDTCMKDITRAYKELLRLHIKAEDARYVLPNACFTEYYVIGSVQAWWDFLYGDAGRLQPKAQWEIREVAQEIQRLLEEISPNIFTESLN